MALFQVLCWQNVATFCYPPPSSPLLLSLINRFTYFFIKVLHILCASFCWLEKFLEVIVLSLFLLFGGRWNYNWYALEESDDWTSKQRGLAEYSYNSVSNSWVYCFKISWWVLVLMQGFLSLAFHCLWVICGLSVSFLIPFVETLEKVNSYTQQLLGFRCEESASISYPNRFSLRYFFIIFSVWCLVLSGFNWLLCFFITGIFLNGANAL